MTDASISRPGRNDRCPCGSGKKYKQCCLAKDAATDREAREAAAAAAPAPEADAEAETDTASVHPSPSRRKGTEQPWKRGQQQVRGFQKRSGPRERGGG